MYSNHNKNNHLAKFEEVSVIDDVVMTFLVFSHGKYLFNLRNVGFIRRTCILIGSNDLRSFRVNENFWRSYYVLKGQNVPFSVEGIIKMTYFYFERFCYSDHFEI